MYAPIHFCPINSSKAPLAEIIVKPEIEVVGDSVLPQGIKIDNNHRLTYVNHLFSGSQEDYLRVLSMLNTKQNLNEALQFIDKVVKPDYENWEDKSVYESQFKEAIKRHFES